MTNQTVIIHDGPYPFALRLLLKMRKMAARFFRPKLNRKIKQKLDGVNFSILSNNCLGGVFYHDAGHYFTSPTINLAFDGPDFIRFLERPSYYLEKDIEFLNIGNNKFPIGVIDDVKISFVHYKSEKEASEAWERRKHRIIWDNLFIVATDHDGLYLPEMLARFDKLPYKNKVMFTAKKYPQYPWAVQVPQFKHRNNVRIMTAFANFKGQRYYETCFDLAEWIQSYSVSPDAAEKHDYKVK